MLTGTYKIEVCIQMLEMVIAVLPNATSMIDEELAIWLQEINCLLNFASSVTLTFATFLSYEKNPLSSFSISVSWVKTAALYP